MIKDQIKRLFGQAAKNREVELNIGSDSDGFAYVEVGSDRFYSSSEIDDYLSKIPRKDMEQL